jgi:hypothetical protein
MGGERTLDKALNQALRLKAAKAVMRLPARLRMVGARVLEVPQLPEVALQHWLDRVLAVCGRRPSR